MTERRKAPIAVSLSGAKAQLLDVEWWVVEVVATIGELQRDRSRLREAGRRGWVLIDQTGEVVSPIECYTGDDAQAKALARAAEERLSRAHPVTVLMFANL